MSQIYGGDRAQLIVCLAKEDIHFLSEKVRLRYLKMNAHIDGFCGSNRVVQFTKSSLASDIAMMALEWEVESLWVQR